MPEADLSLKLVEWIPLYWANRKPGRGRANGFILRTDAAALVAQGLAEWSNRKYNSILLKWKEWELPKIDQSCRMGPNTIIKAADGNDYYIQLAAAWNGRFTDPPKKPQPVRQKHKAKVQAPYRYDTAAAA